MAAGPPLMPSITTRAPGPSSNAMRTQTGNRSWTQVPQVTAQIRPSGLPWFQPQIATVKPSNVNYPMVHLLGIPQEIRDTILELLQPMEEVFGGRPTTGYENYQLVCRQTFHETSRRWNYQPATLVPSNRSGQFISRTLDITVIHSNAYHNVKSLFLEIRHNAPSIVFCQMAQVLRLSTQLEELHLFGVGPDGYGVDTSSVGHGCGKHDLSVRALPSRLQIDGQQYRRRIGLLNSILWLQHLRVLVLDNLNMPLLRAHVLKNKPRLEKLYVAADPRTVLHPEYKSCASLALEGLLFATVDDPPPIKDLHVSSNAIFTASQIASKVATTLQSLEWVIPDAFYQVYGNKISFYREAAILLQTLQLHATQLRELRVCIHGPMSEDHYDFGNFMGGFKACVSLLPSLQLVELHVHSTSAWFASEFITSLPASVTRLYVTDLLVSGDVQKLSASISAKTITPLKYAIDSDSDIGAIGENLDRQDYIQFSRSKLGFVGYEYLLNIQDKAAKKQHEDMLAFFKLNGRLLEKERNRHLASLEGKFIPPKKGGVIEHEEDTESSQDDLRSAATQDEVEENRIELATCILGQDNEYFGDEDVAEVVFQHEPVAKGGCYSCPALVEVDDEPKFSNHWLSK